MERKLPERYYSPPTPHPMVTSSETLFASANPYGWPNMLQPQWTSCTHPPSPWWCGIHCVERTCPCYARCPPTLSCRFAEWIRECRWCKESEICHWPDLSTRTEQSEQSWYSPFVSGGWPCEPRLDTHSRLDGNAIALFKWRERERDPNRNEQQYSVLPGNSQKWNAMEEKNQTNSCLVKKLLEQGCESWWGIHCSLHSTLALSDDLNCWHQLSKISRKARPVRSSCRLACHGCHCEGWIHPWPERNALSHRTSAGSRPFEHVKKNLPICSILLVGQLLASTSS